jgi:hypothetical protein
MVLDRTYNEIGVQMSDNGQISGMQWLWMFRFSNVDISLAPERAHGIL